MQMIPYSYIKETDTKKCSKCNQTEHEIRCNMNMFCSDGCLHDWIVVDKFGIIFKTLDALRVRDLNGE